MKITDCIAIAAIAVLLASGCTDKSPESKAPASSSLQSDPHWVHRSTPNAKVAVVFIHGIIGDLLISSPNSS